MPFDAAKFESAALQPRRKRIDVDALSPWFAEGEPAVWEVRGLSATELHRAIDAGSRQGSVENIVKAITSSADQVKAVRAALGLSADVPGEIAKRLEMLVMGSVSPTVELPTAVRLAEHFPVEFMLLTNAISELTGQGSELGKPAAASQPTPA